MAQQKKLIDHTCRDRLIEAVQQYQEHPDPETQADRTKALRDFTDFVLYGKKPED